MKKILNLRQQILVHFYFASIKSEHKSSEEFELGKKYLLEFKNKVQTTFLKYKEEEIMNSKSKKERDSHHNKDLNENEGLSKDEI